MKVEERLSNLPKVIQLVNTDVRLQSRAFTTTASRVIDSLHVPGTERVPGMLDFQF